MTDKGLNGVMGGYPNGYPAASPGCGQWYNQCPSGLRAEFYEPDEQASYNQSAREAQSAMADFQSCVNRGYSGM